MARLIDLSGRQFGRLTVKRRGPNGKNGKARWKCVCDCGGETLSGGSDLRQGKSTNCGCVRVEKSTKRFQTHAASKTLAYQRWCDMKQRIRRDPRYVDRQIDPRWVSFENFFADMGECPEGYSLERVNNDLGYFPGNCEWIPIGDQTKNTSRTVWVDFEGETVCMSEAIRRRGLNPNVVWQRVYRGWPIQQALGFEPRTQP